MPELPEVEVVRAGLERALIGATVTAAEVFDGRSLKRHLSAAEIASGQAAASHGKTLDARTQQLRANDFVQRITGATFLTPARRGKFMWIPLQSREHLQLQAAGAAGGEPAQALLAHLAMSGQLLLRTPAAPEDKHVRIRLWVTTDAGEQLRLDFADQRRFGSLAIDRLIPTSDGKPAGWGTSAALLPQQAAHIARDLLDLHCDFAQVAKTLKTKQAAIKKVLLDQQLLSGVGNIYADEALWESQLHPETPAARIALPKLEMLLHNAAGVMAKALAEGGTSFDELYVNIAGEAGYFARSLQAYGRSGEACLRCGSTLISSQTIGRTSHFCPHCQRKR